MAPGGMAPLTLESTRSGFVESVHRVSVAVTDTEGRLVASAGELRFH
jgi:L-asparaginase II